MSHGVAGLLGAIPVLCMGLFAPPAALLAGRLGARNAVALCVTVIAVFGLGRAIVPGAVGIIVLTFGVGAGMGLAGALLPVAVKERFRDHPAFATGVYATAIQLGSALSAAIAVPIAQQTIGWRGSLIVFSVFTAGLVVAWLVLMDTGANRNPATQTPPRLPWKSRTGWILVAVFALLSIAYYGLNAWLPASYVERGWAPGSAGGLLAVLNAAALPASLAVPFAADRVGSRRRYLATAAAALTAAAFGIVMLPDAAWLWVVAIGASVGTLFPLILTLPLDVADRPSDVGAVAGLMLGVGYSVAATSPVGLGLVRDVSGSFSTSMWLIVASGALLFASTLLVSPDRLRRGIGRPGAPA